MRVTDVAKAMKDAGECGKCGEKLLKGSAYRWIKPRYGSRRVRCMKPECRFRGSDLASNDTVSQALAAHENAEDALYALDEKADLDDFACILTDLADELDNAKDEFQEKADNIRNYFPDSQQADDLEEKAGEVESFIDSCRDFDAADHLQPDDRAEESDEKVNQPLTKENREALEEAIGSVLGEFPGL